MISRIALSAIATLAIVAVARADDASELAMAKSRAEGAPEALSRRTLGQVALPTYGTAKFRNVRAYYKHNQLINDQVVFCGELDVVVPGTTTRSGWTKFIYLPGDPTTLFTDTEGIGTPEIGPQVRKRWCDREDIKWLPADFTADFQRMPATFAEAKGQ